MEDNWAQIIIELLTSVDKTKRNCWTTISSCSRCLIRSQSRVAVKLTHIGQRRRPKAEHTALKNYFWGNEYTFRKLIKVRELVSVSGN